MAAPDKYLVLTAEQIAIAVGPNREVLLELRIDRSETGLMPNVGLMLQLSAGEARQFASAIARKADEAEAGLPRA